MSAKTSPSPIVSLQDLRYAWDDDAPVLSIPEFVVRSGEHVFLQGPSGGGKSTLLGVIAGVFAPTGGEATILAQPFHAMSAAARDRVRAEAMGVIFQQFNLVPYLGPVDNVLLPCRFSRPRAERVGNSEAARIEAARELLRRLGVADGTALKRPSAALSVGQQQRVAAARALIGAPPLIIADEPTSALDAETRDRFIETLLSEARSACVVFVSHDPSLAGRFDRRVAMAEINRPSQGEAGARPPAEHAMAEA